MQIPFINILMDGPPSQSLGVDPVDPAIMRRPPRKKNAPIITQRLLMRVLFYRIQVIVCVYPCVLGSGHVEKGADGGECDLGRMTSFLRNG
jgi:Ca2+-transporting ATPase